MSEGALMRRALFLQAFLTGYPGETSKKDSKEKPLATSKKDPEKTPLLPTRVNYILIIGVLVLCEVTGVRADVHLLEQPGNLWITWANKTGQTDFCLSLQSATSPFRTCLIGIPQYSLDTFKGYVTDVTACNKTELANQTACLIQTLNTTLLWDPQELDILGSQMIKNGTTRTCVTFGSVCYKENNSTTCHNFDGNFNGTGGAEAELRDFIEKWKDADSLTRPYINQSWTMVSPINTESFSISSRYCGFTSNETRYYRGNLSNWCSSKRGEWSAGYSNGTECSNNTDCGGNCTAEWNYYAYGFTFRGQPGSEVLWNNGTAKALPPGIFLICGDRAWQGIPRNALGGPCYLGQLTMLSPNFTTWMTYGPNITGHHRVISRLTAVMKCSFGVLQQESLHLSPRGQLRKPEKSRDPVGPLNRLTQHHSSGTYWMMSRVFDTRSCRTERVLTSCFLTAMAVRTLPECVVSIVITVSLYRRSSSRNMSIRSAWTATPIGSWLRGLFEGIGEWAVHLLKGLLLGLVVILLLVVCLPCLLQFVSSSIRKMINNSISYHTEYKKLQKACRQPENGAV
nr:envelope protein [Avian leukemia virus]